jgi:N-ethylmaleimide reductase
VELTSEESVNFYQQLNNCKMKNKILTAYTKGPLNLKNHLVMAPMTRSRAINNTPNELMAEYYGQRTGAGLIITEGTAPAPEALGYPRIPGIFSRTQVVGWKDITAAVHAGDSKIFLQLMHTGRIGHQDNLPAGIRLVGASSIRAAGQIFTDTKGLQDHSKPEALTTEEVKAAITAHVTASLNAMKAGFDGIELHGANGYLIEQFLNPNCNTRTDEFGGSMEGRAKFVLELAGQISKTIGKDKVGIRVSPYSTMGDLKDYNPEEVHATYKYLAEELNKMGIAYVHIGFSPTIPRKTLDAIRAGFNGTILYCNGFTPVTAEIALNNGTADLIAFGRSFLANPDLDQRIADKDPLNPPDTATFYTAGAKGFTDYPVAELAL